MQTKNTNTPGEGGFGLSDYYDTQSSKLVQSKNETAAGIALVQAAAVDLKNLKITNSLEMKMCESSDFLSAPVPDRQTPSSPDTSDVAPVLLANMAQQQDLHNTMGQLFTESPEPRPLHHLLLVDVPHGDPHQQW